MAKRFTDTEKWKKEFIKGLSPKMKLLWFYILDDCDHCGMWQVDMEVASLRIGEKITYEEAFIALGSQFQVYGKNKWFIEDFVSFQYGQLRPTNRMHQAVINTLTKYNVPVINGHIRPLQGAKEKDKEKEKEKDKEQEQAIDPEIVLENVTRETDPLPGELVWRDELYRESLFRLARSYSIPDVENLLDRWEGWYVNKFDWRNKDLQEMRLSFESWIKDPKSRQNGKPTFNKNDRAEFNQNELAIIAAHASGGSGT